MGRHLRFLFPPRRPSRGHPAEASRVWIEELAHPVPVTARSAIVASSGVANTSNAPMGETGSLADPAGFDACPEQAQATSANMRSICTSAR